MGCGSSKKDEVIGIVPEEKTVKSDKDATGNGTAPISSPKDDVADAGNAAQIKADEAQEVPDRYFKRVRRTSVSAEAGMDPSKVEIVVNPKSEHEKAQIQQFIQDSQSFLFKGINEEKVNQIAKAMKKQLVAEGASVIQQGEDGDLFFLVAEGDLEVFLTRGEGVKEEKVAAYGPGGSFGELALMYLCPRAATVKAVTDCVLWTLDRVQFQALICGGPDGGPTKPVWEDLLAEMELLKKLNKYERMILADAIESEDCGQDEVVIEQGDEEGKCFYIVESGSCAAVLDLQDGTEPVQCKEYTRGMYFGELAVLERGAQRVSVKVTSEECQLLKVSAEVFEKILIPIKADLEAASDAFYALLFQRVSQSEMQLMGSEEEAEATK